MISPAWKGFKWPQYVIDDIKKNVMSAAGDRKRIKAIEKALVDRNSQPQTITELVQWFKDRERGVEEYYRDFDSGEAD